MKIKPREILKSNLQQDIMNPDFWSSVSEGIKKEMELVREKFENSTNSKFDKNNLKCLETKLDNLENIKPFLNLFLDSAKNIYSRELKRFPSLFLTERKDSACLEKEITDLFICLDCSINRGQKWDGFDHHSEEKTENETEVATTLTLDFSKEKLEEKNGKLSTSFLYDLYKRLEVFQRQKEFLNSLGKKTKTSKLKNFVGDFIPFTTGNLDTDAILAHFSLLYPTKAKKYEEYIKGAALSGDLNMEVSDGAKNLTDIISGILKIFSNFRKHYKNYLSNSKRELSDEAKEKLINFDNIFGNAIVGMIPKILEYVSDNRKKGNEDYYSFFSYANINFSNLIDEKTREIEKLNNNYLKYNKLKEDGEENNEELKKLEEEGLMEIKVEKSSVFFYFNHNLAINTNGIPPESFYKYIKTRTDIDTRNIKYCIICVQKNGNKNCSDNYKSVFISNFVNSITDLEKYCLKDKLGDLNELELSYLKKLLKKLEKEKKNLPEKPSNRTEKRKIMNLNQKIKSIETKIKKGSMKGLFRARNGFLFLSSSYSPLDKIIKIINKK